MGTILSHQRGRAARRVLATLLALSAGTMVALWAVTETRSAPPESEEASAVPAGSFLFRNVGIGRTSDDGVCAESRCRGDRSCLVDWMAVYLGELASGGGTINRYAERSCTASQCAASDRGCPTACAAESAARCVLASDATCRQACADECPQTCPKECPQACVKACGKSDATTCAAGCAKNTAKTCSAACATQCAEACAAPCAKACSTQCQDCGTSACADAGSTKCAKECAEGCVAQCAATKQKTCAVGCSAKCAQQRSVQCASHCAQQCAAKCAQQCPAQCAAQSAAVCTAKAAGACSKSCASTCQANCDKKCSASGADSCPAKCNAACPEKSSATWRATDRSPCRESCSPLVQAGEPAADILTLRRAVGQAATRGTIFDTEPGEGRAWAEDITISEHSTTPTQEHVMVEVIRQMQSAPGPVPCNTPIAGINAPVVTFTPGACGVPAAVACTPAESSYAPPGYVGPAPVPYPPGPIASVPYGPAPATYYAEPPASGLRRAEQKLQEAAEVLEAAREYDRADEIRALADQVRREARQREAPTAAVQPSYAPPMR